MLIWPQTMAHRFCLALLLLAVFGRPAQSADCGPLKILSTVQMQPLGRGPLMLVPVRVNSVRENFLLDTGGSVSQLIPVAANDLRLSAEPAKIRLYDIYGNSAARQTMVERFDVGNLEARSLALWIAPSRSGDDYRRDFFPPPRWRPRHGMDGVLAPDLMSNYDVELDFGSNTLKYLSQDHCAGQVVYWNAGIAAVVPMQFRNLQITVPVELDGHALTALIDTGSPRSTMNLDVAQSVFGLAPGAGLNRAGTLGMTGQPFYTTRMRQMSFEGVEVDNPVLDVIPDLMHPSAQAANTSNPLALPQLLIGMDVLSKLHLYFAFREKRIYITEAAR